MRCVHRAENGIWSLHSFSTAELLGTECIMGFDKLKMYGLNNLTVSKDIHRSSLCLLRCLWMYLSDQTSGSMSRGADRAEDEPCSSSLWGWRWILDLSCNVQLSGQTTHGNLGTSHCAKVHCYSQAVGIRMEYCFQLCKPTAKIWSSLWIFSIRD